MSEEINEVEQGFDELKKDFRDELFEKLGVSNGDKTEALDVTLSLNPTSLKLVLLSQVYKNMKGKYTFEELLDIYFDHHFSEGFQVGIQYGKQKIFEDIQNNKLSIGDIKNMDDENLYQYLRYDLIYTENEE